ncbi:hypothetical protein [Luteibacter sp. Lutesp34]|uniref:hypothetical protein n=1 Tax=Luteibacter sp. Lutesp34 TaxID=3243030 RepID=UPI0039B536E3
MSKAAYARASVLLCGLVVASCNSTPPGVVDDSATTATLEFAVDSSQTPSLALVTSTPTDQTYRNWHSLQPYLANAGTRQVTYKDFEVINGPEHFVILVPPASWETKGWVMVCEETTSRQSHGTCDTEGMVGNAVVHVTGWSSDIEGFRAIVRSASRAVTEAGLGVPVKQATPLQ